MPAGLPRRVLRFPLPTERSSGYQAKYPKEGTQNGAKENGGPDIDSRCRLQSADNSERQQADDVAADARFISVSQRDIIVDGNSVNPPSRGTPLAMRMRNKSLGTLLSSAEFAVAGAIALCRAA